MKRIVPLLAGLFLLVGFFVTPASASVPALPHAFYGAVELNDGPAPKGTQVEARGPGVVTDITGGNPITVTEAGKYGGAGGLDPKLVVQGDIEEGTIITFYVNNVSTDQTYPFDSGEVKELPLSVTIAPSPPPTGDGVGAPTYYPETNIFGIEGRLLISYEGKILRAIETTSKDGNLTITIPKGTIALGKDGKRLKSLEAAVDESPPDPPEDAHIIGLAYNFGPDGSTFDPGINLTWRYDPDALPEGVAEEGLFIAYYDQVAGKWVELECVVDTENNTITASVEHFTTFAIIGAGIPPPPPPPAPVPPAPAPVPAPAPAPAPAPVPAPPPAPAPAPVPAPPPAPPAPAPPEVIPPTAINWPVLGGIIAAVIIVALLVFFLIRRRA